VLSILSSQILFALSPKLLKQTAEALQGTFVDMSGFQNTDPGHVALNFLKLFFFVTTST
jgi:hypothetical protein